MRAIRLRVLDLRYFARISSRCGRSPARHVTHRSRSESMVFFFLSLCSTGFFLFLPLSFSVLAILQRKSNLNHTQRKRERESATAWCAGVVPSSQYLQRSDKGMFSFRPRCIPRRRRPRRIQRFPPPPNHRRQLHFLAVPTVKPQHSHQSSHLPRSQSSGSDDSSSWVTLAPLPCLGIYYP